MSGSGCAHRRRHRLDALAPAVFGRGRKDIVPDHREPAGGLAQTGGAGHEPPVQVSGALAVTQDVDAFDALDGEHGALDAGEHDPHLGQYRVREIARAVDVVARLEDPDERQAAGRKSLQTPALVGPDVLGVGLAARLAGPVAFAVSVGLGLRVPKRLRSHAALERPRIPLLHRRCPQLAGSTFAPIVRVLWHGCTLPLSTLPPMEWSEQFYAWRAGDGCPS